MPAANIPVKVVDIVRFLLIYGLVPATQRVS